VHDLAKFGGLARDILNHIRLPVRLRFVCFREHCMYSIEYERVCACVRACVCVCVRVCVCVCVCVLVCVHSLLYEPCTSSVQLQTTRKTSEDHDTSTTLHSTQPAINHYAYVDRFTNTHMQQTEPNVDASPEASMLCRNDGGDGARCIA